MRIRVARRIVVLSVRHVFPLLCSLFVAISASAHDFWIEPDSFRPPPGALVAIHLRVGEHLEGDEVGRNPELIERFAIVTASGETNVVSGLVRATGPGMVVYRSRGTPLELGREKFEQFVEQEGVQWLRAERARRGEANAPWRESFSRCAKSFLGDPSAKGFMNRVGLRLELVPRSSPVVGKPLSLLLELEGRPVRDALVIALSAADPSRKIERRTDARGRVELPLDRGGMWLIKSVHVVRAPKGIAYEWESLWASLTFELR